MSIVVPHEFLFIIWTERAPTTTSLSEWVSLPQEPTPGVGVSGRTNEWVGACVRDSHGGRADRCVEALLALLVIVAHVAGVGQGGA